MEKTPKEILKDQLLEIIGSLEDSSLVSLTIGCDRRIKKIPTWDSLSYLYEGTEYTVRFRLMEN